MPQMPLAVLIPTVRRRVPNGTSSCGRRSAGCGMRISRSMVCARFWGGAQGLAIARSKGDQDRALYERAADGRQEACGRDSRQADKTLIDDTSRMQSAGAKNTGGRGPSRRGASSSIKTLLTCFLSRHSG